MNAAHAMQALWNEHLSARERRSLIALTGIDFDKEARALLAPDAIHNQTPINAVNVILWHELPGHLREELILAFRRWRQLVALYEALTHERSTV